MNLTANKICSIPLLQYVSANAEKSPLKIFDRFERIRLINGYFNVEIYFTIYFQEKQDWNT